MPAAGRRATSGGVRREADDHGRQWYRYRATEWIARNPYLSCRDIRGSMSAGAGRVGNRLRESGRNAELHWIRTARDTGPIGHARVKLAGNGRGPAGNCTEPVSNLMRTNAAAQEIDCRKPFAVPFGDLFSTSGNTWPGVQIATSMPFGAGLRCTCGMVARRNSWLTRRGPGEADGPGRASRTAMTGG